MPDNDAPVTPSGADDNGDNGGSAQADAEPGQADAAENPPDADALALVSLKADLNRTGNFPSDDSYLLSLIAASRQWLDAQGIHDNGSALYAQILVSNAAWIYRKRVTGEAQPNFLRRMSHDFKLSGAGRDEA